MLNVFIIISKYLFMIYMAVFLWNGFIAGTNKSTAGKYFFALSNQRIAMVLFHINAFALLIWNDPSDISGSAGKAVAILVFILFGCFLGRKIYPNSSHILWNGVFFLADIGIVTLYTLKPELADKQLVWHALGFIAAIILPALLDRLPRLDKFKTFYITFAIILLISTLIFGDDEFGAKNWISIGSFSFQPSEVVKLLFIAYLASALNQKPDVRQLAVPSVLCAVILLCFVAQKDLGSALIFFMSFMVVVYIATSNVLYFVIGTGAAALGSFIAYHIFSHIRVRVEAWLDPWSHIDTSGYQIAQSLFAIATYGLTGAGLTHVYSSSIPVIERDFIFSAICEEFGVIFGMGVILCFLMIFLEGAVGALNAKNRFLCLFCAGLTALLAFQCFVILGGVTKLIPLTGVTLPFISYGGTSVLMCYVLIGIIQWVYKSCVQYLDPEEAEEETLPRKPQQNRQKSQRPQVQQKQQKQQKQLKQPPKHAKTRKRPKEDISLDEVLDYNGRRRKNR